MRVKAWATNDPQHERIRRHLGRCQKCRPLPAGEVHADCEKEIRELRTLPARKSKRKVRTT